ncbi:alpha-amylase family glycosyl hydrolase [Pollutibacter soli]|uniref:alpha-amylase family glycosyl hydrolase n=1 Tax=Pollutibacter soli TaxID=3034157 RepID=UPI00301393A6
MKIILYYFLIVSLITGCKKTGGDVPPPEPEVETAPLPAGAKDGVAFINDGKSAIITLYAPEKSSVAIIGDFNNWNAQTGKMKNTPDKKTWWTQIDNLEPGTEYAYQFLVNGSLKVGDPYSEKILDPSNDQYISSTVYPGLKAYPTGKTTGIVSVMQGKPAAYTWKYTNFNRPEKTNLVIYELLIRDFSGEHSYASTLQKIDYLKTLGINAIELMPVNEFEGNLSWGYNPSYYFAPDKYYGTKNALKNFIDECHGKGIAVIVDMVLNHSFSQSPLVQLYFDGTKPTTTNPWYNADAKHPYNVGFDFNHESAQTKTFAKNVIKFWIQEYHIDGYRFDLSKGFTQKQSSDDASFAAYDPTRVAIWKEYNSFIKTIDPNNFYVILEHFADVQEEKMLADEGMMLWGNLNYNMNEATMGWLGKSDFSWGFYKRHAFDKAENLVAYMESHDEERINFKNITYGNAAGTYSIKANLPVSLTRSEMGAAFYFAMPGPKMIWQFGELGYDISIETNGRTGEKPIKWEYFDDPNRKALYNAYSKFIQLRKNNSIFETPEFTYDLTGAVKYIKLMDGAATVVVVGNFDVVNQNANINFGAAGTWYDAGGGSINLGSTNYVATLSPGEYHIYSNTILQ